MEAARATATAQLRARPTSTRRSPRATDCSQQQWIASTLWPEECNLAPEEEATCHPPARWPASAFKSDWLRADLIWPLSCSPLAMLDLASLSPPIGRPSNCCPKPAAPESVGRLERVISLQLTPLRSDPSRSVLFYLIPFYFVCITLAENNNNKSPRGGLLNFICQNQIQPQETTQVQSRTPSILSLSLPLDRQ